jgi:hypothetical protein
MRKPSPAASPPAEQPPSDDRARTAITMLGLATTKSRRPVDELIRRLQQPDGLSWLDLGVPTCGRTPPDQVAGLLDGSLTLEAMVAHKDRSKKQVSTAPTMDHALSSLAVYCLSVASALAFHDVMISTQKREEWDELFIDLSEVVPPAWRNVLLKAAMTE